MIFRELCVRPNWNTYNNIDYPLRRIEEEKYDYRYSCISVMKMTLVIRASFLRCSTFGFLVRINKNKYSRKDVADCFDFNIVCGNPKVIRINAVRYKNRLGYYFIRLYDSLKDRTSLQILAFSSRTARDLDKHISLYFHRFETSDCTVYDW